MITFEEAPQTTLLLDADTIAYTTALATQEIIPSDNKMVYNDVIWSEIIENGIYDKETDSYRQTDIQSAVEYAVSRVEDITHELGLDDVECYFTSGRCFRYDIYPEYKGNRKGRHNLTPHGLTEIKQAMVDKFGGRICTEIEADDIVVYKKLQDPDKYLLASADKDVLYSTPGKHYNYYRSSYYSSTGKLVSNSPHYIDVSEDEARYWPYIQVLLGDTVDNIPHPKGCGLVTVWKLLCEFLDIDMPKPSSGIELCKSIPNGIDDVDMWDAVLEIYYRQGSTEEAAELNMQLVNMRLLTYSKDTTDIIELNKWKELIW